MSKSNAPRPLAGVRVIEFTHTVMGPCCGLVLADMGAEVIRIEPPEGDRTRRLQGFGAGFFGFFNRNKKSVALDLKAPAGIEAARRLIASADVLVENFAPATMRKLGLHWAAAKALNPKLVYCSLKGFMPGPYENRAALDEVVQMMGGLAYMTGPRGKPLRAGTSIVDIGGALFGAIGILAALRERDRTGEGRKVDSALYETAVFLTGQHLAFHGATGMAVPPMPERVRTWGVYEVFDSADGGQVFIGITSDPQWRRFCDVFSLPALAAEPAFALNNDRCANADRLIPLLVEAFRKLPQAEIMRLAEVADISFAPVSRPEDLLADPHLLASGGIIPQLAGAGRSVPLPLLPLAFDGARLPKETDAAAIGADTRTVLASAGYTAAEIDALARDGAAVVA